MFTSLLSSSLSRVYIIVVLIPLSCLHPCCPHPSLVFTSLLSSSLSRVYILVVLIPLSCLHPCCPHPSLVFTSLLSSSLSRVYILFVLIPLSCLHPCCPHPSLVFTSLLSSSLSCAILYIISTSFRNPRLTVCIGPPPFHSVALLAAFFFCPYSCCNVVFPILFNPLYHLP